ncbi:protein PECTIC ARABINOGALACTAN SYNTHESIS-RELATED-like isoform X2 [Brassica napus]|uniref:protein PECTIC ARABINOGALACTAN SYNTHESIS-RELATED-like isoform X2 n=1 Tax=Brassica napus TaxID=3708 RepID=UPI0006AAE3B7|nr:protein PECTIC ARABINOGALACTAN SYNTHESIS-RELATED-like isoform X2 [Brassica napus]
MAELHHSSSWKPCTEGRIGGVSGILENDVLPENETNGYVFIHAEGGLNQQRIAFCNAVAVAKIKNAALILLVLKQDQIVKTMETIKRVSPRRALLRGMAQAFGHHKPFR